ncbi:hypothetical protein K439DRAFT_1643279, partial [Ramaria rubella]
MYVLGHRDSIAVSDSIVSRSVTVCVAAISLRPLHESVLTSCICVLATPFLPNVSLPFAGDAGTSDGWYIFSRYRSRARRMRNTRPTGDFVSLMESLLSSSVMLTSGEEIASRRGHLRGLSEDAR